MHSLTGPKRLAAVVEAKVVEQPQMLTHSALRAPVELCILQLAYDVAWMGI